jgi:3D (Asp-Asp-Asp) domain-containing protein
VPLPVLVVAALLTIAALALQGTRGSKSGGGTVVAAGPQLAAYSVNARELSIDQTAAAETTAAAPTEALRSEAPTTAAAPAPSPAATIAVKATAAPTTAAPAPVGDGAPPGAQPLGEFTVVCYVIVGTTYSGEPTGPNVVAVDKSVIPLHTNLWIEGVGPRTALDIGGGVRGKTLDLWMTWPDCKQFGKQHLNVYVIP